MPQGYRVELCPNNRAVCKNKECKDAGVKILKGELRFGSLFTVQEHTSWAYKHWGCVTPQQLENLQGFLEGNMDLLDGYDELPKEDQERIDFALENGHVRDEEWRGDVEVNRPGEKGFRVKAPKEEAAKKAKKEDEDTEGSPKPQKKRGRPAKDTGDSEAPAPKKRGQGKKAVVKEEDEVEEGEQEDAPAPKKRGRGKKTAVKDEDVEGEEVKKPKAKKKGVVKTEDVEEDDVKTEDAEEEEAVKPKAKRTGVGKTEAVDDNEAPAPKKGRAKKVTVAKEESAGDGEEPKPKPKVGKAAGKGTGKATEAKPSRGGSRKAATKVSYAEEPTDEESGGEVEAPKGKQGAKKIASANADKPAPQKRGRKKKVASEDE